jgi:hypothetical protein
MFKKIFALAAVFVFAVMLTSCSKYIKPEDKAAYDAASVDIYNAQAEVKTTDKPELRKEKELFDLFNTAKSNIAAAQDLLDKGKYDKASEMAKKAATQAKDARELPAQVSTLIDQTEKKLAFAKEVGLDKTYGKKIKEVNDLLWEARDQVKRVGRYEFAKSKATWALQTINKAIEDVETANNALTKAKTALVEAKDAGADNNAADLIKSAEEAVETAKKEMDAANFTAAQAAAQKAEQLAKDALKKSKEGK